MIAGVAYGVVLNDRAEREELAARFVEPPYKAAPVAPVLYIKPRTCFAPHGAPVAVPGDLAEVEVAATVGLSFGPDGRAVAACLALDVSERHRDYYRPAIRERCRDRFLPLGSFAAVPHDPAALEVVTRIDGVEAHRWSLDRLVRAPLALAEELMAFMTLEPGDLLLVGLAGDAPTARVGQAIEVSAAGLPTLRTRLAAEEA